MKWTIKACSLLVAVVVLTAGVVTAATTPVKNYTVSIQSLDLATRPEAIVVSAEALTVVGTYRLLTYALPHLPPNIFWDQTLVRRLADLMGVPLFIAGFFAKDAWSVVISIAAFFGQTAAQIDEARAVTARLGHSFRYLVREGQVFTEAGWRTFYTATSREWYGHESALYIDIHQLTRQHTLDLGFLGRTDHSPNFQNANFIMSQALNRWFHGLPPGSEDWRGVSPDPDPHRVIDPPTTDNPVGNQ